MSDLWSRAAVALEHANPVTARGEVTDVIGLIVEGNGPAVGVGTTCRILQGRKEIPAQVVGFRKERILLMPFGELHGIAPGATIVTDGSGEMVKVGASLLGRSIDPMGDPIDGLGSIHFDAEVPLFRSPPPALTRQRIHETCDVGIKCVNTMLTIGKGQRVAVMAGSGVGKSTFLGMIAKHARTSVNVIALVGERGREVREFIERDLGPEGMARSVVVVATSDTSALMRLRAAFMATAIAEYFRDQGEDVTLLLDSITRFCMAQREVGLAVGEPPSSSGYTPSVFAILPKLLERAGTSEGSGAITGFYTVLVEGDDMNEPIADAVRGILDGHIVLSRALASRGHFPAIDVLQSISRVMPDIADSSMIQRAQLARRVLADYHEVEDLITIGAYQPGQNEKVDFAVQKIDALRRFLVQSPQEKFGLEDCNQQLTQLLAAAAAAQRPGAARAQPRR
ncbi:MAG: FliI/YscN family ATPase [Bdellovibrionales bacterium]|nr:FliI/YscN family ATPase [Bdellovibrionales bacterium]